MSLWAAVSFDSARSDEVDVHLDLPVEPGIDRFPSLPVFFPLVVGSPIAQAKPDRIDAKRLQLSQHVVIALCPFAEPASALTIENSRSGTFKIRISSVLYSTVFEACKAPKLATATNRINSTYTGVSGLK